MYLREKDQQGQETWDDYGSYLPFQGGPQPCQAACWQSLRHWSLCPCSLVNPLPCLFPSLDSLSKLRKAQKFGLRALSGQGPSSAFKPCSRLEAERSWRVEAEPRGWGQVGSPGVLGEWEADGQGTQKGAGLLAREEQLRAGRSSSEGVSSPARPDVVVLQGLLYYPLGTSYASSCRGMEGGLPRRRIPTQPSCLCQAYFYSPFVLSLGHLPGELSTI